MHPKWRFFRHDAGRAAGPPPSAYVLLFLGSVAVGQWSLARYGVVVAWPANAVLAAALLQLHRRPALKVLGACFAINLAGNWLRSGYLQSEPGYMIVLNAVLNAGEAFLTALLARRFCGAGLDMRRPVRLARFAFMAVAPAVLVCAVIGSLGQWRAPSQLLPSMQGYFTVEGLAMLIVTPPLLLLARRDRFAAPSAGRPWEPAVLIGLLAAVSVGVFAQQSAPLAFLTFLPLLVIAFRLTPAWSALAVILVAVIAAGFTYNGLGPMTLSAIDATIWDRNSALETLQRSQLMFNLYMAAVLFITLPASTVLTERRRLEARLQARTQAAIAARRAAEAAAAAKSRFLSMMSHEMRTPLNGVAGYAELLAGRACLDAAAARDVEGVRRSGALLSALVEDILDFAHDELTIVAQPFRLSKVVREALGEIEPEADAKGLGLLMCGDLDSPSMQLGDERRVRQVLRHLLSNAVKFTSAGAVEVSLRLDGAAEIRVSDSGPGLSPAILTQLFQPFAPGDASTSREHGGAGMGLALSRRLAAAMGGALEAQNRPGGGAVFTLRLPLPAIEAAPAAPKAEADADVQGRSPRVLVVDDHPTNREVARRMLEAIGCEVAIACDGAEAVEATGGCAYDLVLMDVRMPRMDGLEATRTIRRSGGARARTPIVAMTADAMPEDVTRCLAAGMDGHLAKPVSIAALAAALQRHLGAGAEPLVAAAAGR